MTKFSFKQLSRGVKLLSDHIYDPIISGSNNVASGSVQFDQLKEPRGSTTLYFAIPGFDDSQKEAAIPVILPEFQELFTTSNTAVDKTRIVLDELTVSFDQRAEAAAIASKGFENASSIHLGGALDFDNVTALDIQVSLLERFRGKTNNEGAAITANNDTEYRTVFALEFPAELYTSLNQRQNPVNIKMKEIALDTSKVYMLVISCPGLNDKTASAAATYKLALPSFSIAMKIKSNLVGATPSTALGAQNVPTLQSSAIADRADRRLAPSTKPHTIVKPGAGELIVAEDAGHLTSTPYQAAIEQLDERFLNKLEAGVNRFSERVPSNALQHDSAYSVIAVPCFGNLGTPVDSQLKANGLPGNKQVAASHAPEFVPVVDRKIIPIRHPMIIHHVIACFNYTGDQAGSVQYNRPAATGASGGVFSNRIGVAIGTGMEGDRLAYQQIAEHTFTPDGNDSNVISKHNLPFLKGFASSDAVSPSPAEIHNWDLYSIPIVGGNVNATGTGDVLRGVGFTTQGCPYYVGKSRQGDAQFSDTNLRSNTATNSSTSASHPPRTQGAEQWIEVRWALQNFKTSSSTFDTLGDIIASSSVANQVMVGRYGFWVYIIGKRILC